MSAQRKKKEEQFNALLNDIVGDLALTPAVAADESVVEFITPRPEPPPPADPIESDGTGAAAPVAGRAPVRELLIAGAIVTGCLAIAASAVWTATTDALGAPEVASVDIPEPAPDAPPPGEALTREPNLTPRTVAFFTAAALPTLLAEAPISAELEIAFADGDGDVRGKNGGDATKTKPKRKRRRRAKRKKREPKAKAKAKTAFEDL